MRKYFIHELEIPIEYEDDETSENDILYMSNSKSPSVK